MTDLAAEHYTIGSLIIWGYENLQKLNKNHELLKYFEMEYEDYTLSSSKDSQIQMEFLEKYARSEKGDFLPGMMERYYIDLRNAVDRIEGVNRLEITINTLKETYNRIREREKNDLPF